MTKTIESTIDMTKYFDEYGKNSRTMLAWVYPSELRSILEKTVELQIDTAKFFNKSMVDTVTKMTAVK